MRKHTIEGAEAVTAWRRDRLVAVGFALPEAYRLAHDTRYDLHALLDLVNGGCPPGLAARILVPLEEAGAV